MMKPTWNGALAAEEIWRIANYLRIVQAGKTQ